MSKMDVRDRSSASPPPALILARPSRGIYLVHQRNEIVLYIKLPLNLRLLNIYVVLTKLFLCHFEMFYIDGTY